MQSQYGLPEIQQFMAEGGCSPLFSISPADVHPSQLQKPQHHHPLSLNHHQHLHLHHHHQQQQMQLRQQPQPPPPPPPSLHHYHSPPATQQLFHHGHQFHLFQQEQQRRIHQQLVQLGLDHDAVPENSSSPARIIAAAGAVGLSPFLGGVDFKLGVNDSLGGGGGDSRERLNDEEGMLQVDDGEEIHQIHPWATREDSNIKEPFWRPLDIDYSNRNTKRSKEKQLQPDASHSACNFKLFSELEAICKPISCNGESIQRNQQTGSGSVLTGENPPAISTTPTADYAHNNENQDQGYDSSTGEEAAQIERPAQTDDGGGRRKRKRQQQQLSSIAAFMEDLVRKLMEHQEGLHRKFLEILDRRDKERMSREETWRQQELAKSHSEAMAKAQDQALANSREAAIVFFLEKITGESISLPRREQFNSPAQEEEHKLMSANPSRWPKAEVQALIQVRSNLEARFQEPGLKGPLWEEVSSAMAAMGYQRSAKRCKEKWENINKYFRKTKDSVKRRSHQSKTCPYFHQLDQLYSKSPAKPSVPATEDDRADMSDLLRAVMAAGEEIHEREGSSMAARQSNSDDNPDDEDEDDEDENDDEGDDEGEEAEGERGGRKDPRP